MEGHRLLCDAWAVRSELGALPDLADAIEILGCLAGDHGRWRDAARLLAAAEASRERLQYRAPRLMAGRDRAAGAVDRAREVLGEAVFTRMSAEGHGAGPDRTLAYARRAVSGQGPPDGPLSREGEVARLVSQGFTNRQIADALHIAERTAENHVQHILTKLGFHTRSQIAAWVVTTGRQ